MQWRCLDCLQYLNGLLEYDAPHTLEWEIRQKPFQDFSPVPRRLWGFAALPYWRTGPCEFFPWPRRDSWILPAWKPFNITLVVSNFSRVFWTTCFLFMISVMSSMNAFIGGMCIPIPMCSLGYWTHLPSVGSASPIWKGKGKLCTPGYPTSRRIHLVVYVLAPLGPLDSLPNHVLNAICPILHILSNTWHEEASFHGCCRKLRWRWSTRRPKRESLT